VTVTGFREFRFLGRPAKYSPGCSGRRCKQIIVSLHWHTRYWSF